MDVKLDCAAVILAGGESRRMGRSKAWLEFGGRPLLAHLVERLESAFPEVVVVGAPGQELPATPARRVDDERPGAGPLAGMAAGLRAVHHPFAFVASCDAPFLNVDVARHLLSVCACYDAAIPQWDGRLHPLQAVYRTSGLPVLNEQLAADRLRVHALLGHLHHAVVPEAELRALDPEGWSFLNMNTPEEYAWAQERWAMRPS